MLFKNEQPGFIDLRPALIIPGELGKIVDKDYVTGVLGGEPIWMALRETPGDGFYLFSTKSDVVNVAVSELVGFPVTGESVLLVRGELQPGGNLLGVNIPTDFMTRVAEARKLLKT